MRAKISRLGCILNRLLFISEVSELLFELFEQFVQTASGHKCCLSFPYYTYGSTTSFKLETLEIVIRIIY